MANEYHHLLHEISSENLRIYFVGSYRRKRFALACITLGVISQGLPVLSVYVFRPCHITDAEVRSHYVTGCQHEYAEKLKHQNEFRFIK